MDLSEPVSRHNFDFRLARFWGSPEYVPGITIIANVLTNPAAEDIKQIVDYFGLPAVLGVLDQLRQREEISETANRLAVQYINSRGHRY